MFSGPLHAKGLIWPSMMAALALAACGEDTVQGGLSQVADARSTLEIGPPSTVTQPTTTTDIEPDVVIHDTDERPDTVERDSTEPTETSEPEVVVGPCAGVDCDDQDPCTRDKCDADSGECQHSDLECAASENPCMVTFCSTEAGGCVEAPNDEPIPCDDEVACTDEDRCQEGVCTGELRSCDDDDACTTDACIDGDCTFTDIPNCVPDSQCNELVAGAHCDDGSASTTADMCVAGKCRGYASTRIGPGILGGAVGLVITEIDFGPGGWTAAFWGLEANDAQTWALAKVTTASAASVYDGTDQDAAFTAIHNGWAGDSDGHVWSFESGEWRVGSDYDDAIFLSDRGVITDLWTTIDEDVAGNPTGTRMWVVGNDGVADEYIRHCRPGDPLFEDAVECDYQELDDFDASSLPKAVAGVQRCDFLGCDGALVATAADAAASGGNYTDTYENVPPGDDTFWNKGATPNQAAQRASRSIAGWGSTVDAQFLAVGTNGYMVHRRSNGSWSAPLQLRADQPRRTFSGVWVGAGLIIISAHQTAANDSTKLDYELWTCPTNKDVEVNSNWTLHVLGQGPNVNAAGLYDVSGRDEGELRVVGAVRKQNGDAPLLDGIVYVRAP